MNERDDRRVEAKAEASLLYPSLTPADCMAVAEVQDLVQWARKKAARVHPCDPIHVLLKKFPVPTR
jgi:hypothetical protein